MSNAQIPLEIPIIGVDSDLQSKLSAELKASRAEKSKRQAVEIAVGDPQRNRRESVRYEVAIPAVCYPISVSNEIDNSAMLNGIVADSSKTGLRLLMDAAQPCVGLDLIVGVESSVGPSSFCAGTVVASKRNSRGMTEVHLRLGGYLHELLQNDLIFPVLDRSKMQFDLPFPERTLASLCKIGAAAAETLDNMLVCPYCQALPTLRTGCSLCLSSNVKASAMIHHFCCAHVDFVEAFETPDGLCCEKCRTRHLIVGSDYEYLDGPNHCEDCGKSNLEKMQIGHCLNCEHRFAMETATQLEIVGYRVNRLDTLALIDTH